MSTLATPQYTVLARRTACGLHQARAGPDLQGHRRGDQRAVDYLIVEVAPYGGPPLHVHHTQDELIHAAKGRFKVQIGEETFVIEEGGFAHLPRGIQHAFLNLTDEPAELNMVFTPGGTHKFFEELAPVARAAVPDRAAIAAVFEKHDMSLLGPAARSRLRDTSTAAAGNGRGRAPDAREHASPPTSHPASIGPQTGHQHHQSPPGSLPLPPDEWHAEMAASAPR